MQNFVDVNGDGVHDQHMSTWDAGLLTITYAVTIIGFIRGRETVAKVRPAQADVVGLDGRDPFGAFLTPTFVGLGTYRSVVSGTRCSVWGWLSTPRRPQMPHCRTFQRKSRGSGSGIYKMASSLGSAIGLALSLTIFNALKEVVLSVTYALQMTGVQGNTSLRFAGMVVMLFNIGLTRYCDHLDHYDRTEGRWKPRPRRDKAGRSDPPHRLMRNARP